MNEPVIYLGTLLALILVAFVTVFFFVYQQRSFLQQQELIQTKEAYEREILQSQLEIQNQTLRQVAEELHDNIGQVLSVASLHVSILDEELTNHKQQPAVQQVHALISTAIQDIRALSKTLDSDTVHRFGLHESLQLELERIGRTGRFKTQLEKSGTPYFLGEQTETMLFRMTQEALNNAIKHSSAHTLVVSLDYRPESFVLIITDDGKGFLLEEVSERDLNHNGSGLRNLQRRAKLLGGSCQFNSRPGQGTRVEISLPPSVPS